MVTEEDLTLGGGHTVQYTDNVSQNCTLKTYIILLSNITSKFNFKMSKRKYDCVKCCTAVKMILRL